MFMVGYTYRNGEIMTNLYTVWVGGLEVTDFYINWWQALDIAEFYSKNGYKDVSIERAH